MKVLLVAATSLDGKIAFDHRHQIETSPRDKKYFLDITMRAGVVVVGNNTFKTFHGPLPNRRTIILTRDTELLKMPKTPEFEYTNETPEKLLERLAKEGVTEVANVGGSQIFSQFHTAGVIDEYHLTICPQFIGDAGIPLLTDLDPLKLQLIHREEWDSGETLAVYTP